MPSRRFTYRDKVDPDSMKPVAREIINRVGSEDEVWIAAALHKHIREEVNYDHSVGPNFNRLPAETYEKGGNCVDLSLLMCSLFRAVGLRCRLIAIDGDESGHMTSAVAFPDDPRAVTDSLTGFYSNQGHLRERTYTWLEDEYFISDHGSRYIGDIQPLDKYSDPEGRFVVQEKINI